MASAIASPKSDPAPDLRLGWTARLSLTARILAVNVFALAMLAGSFVYLDTYRARLSDDRLDQFAEEARLHAIALGDDDPAGRPELARQLAAAGSVRLRLYAPDGRLMDDSFRNGPATYSFRDPRQEPWQKHVARFMDRAFDLIVDERAPPLFVEPAIDRASAWPEVLATRTSGTVESRIRRAPDRTPVLSSAVPFAAGGTLLVTGTARDITRGVRAERMTLGLVLLAVLLASVLLSLFLARTIVRPLRSLARAAVRVRRGRGREVVMPRLPGRHDEIGLLARALADMAEGLRQRIDAVEKFAADVSHELRNPLASLRSAVDSLERVEDPALRSQLAGIIRDDVHRLDRLIGDVADMSRLDGELSRAPFERIDLGPLIEGVLRQRESRGQDGAVRVAFARPLIDTATVMGDGARLERMVANLVDNAVSFSPPGGLVEVASVLAGGPPDEEGGGAQVHITVDDEGPGVPPHAREAIFRRFYSSRPEEEAFGRHSGLGLAIAAAIAKAHGGDIQVEDHVGGKPGARFLIRLPSAPALP